MKYLSLLLFPHGLTSFFPWGFLYPFYNDCRSGVFSKAGAFNPCLEETMPCDDLGVTAKSKKRKCCNRSVTADGKKTVCSNNWGCYGYRSEDCILILPRYLSSLSVRGSSQRKTQRAEILNLGSFESLYSLLMIKHSIISVHEG